jgi:hypothetical protein
MRNREVVSEVTESLRVESEDERFAKLQSAAGTVTLGFHA